MTGFWNKSLIARLTISFLLLSLLVAAIAGIVALVQATDALEESVVERLRVAALARQDELDTWVSTQANDLAFIARWEEVIQPTSTLMRTDPDSLNFQVASTQIADTLRDVVVRRPDFDEIFILNESGVVAVSSQRTSEGLDLSTNRYYTAGRSQTFIQNVYSERTTGRPTMTIATPLLDSLGRRIGVLAVHLNLDRLDRIVLDRAGLGETGEMYLVSETGMFVSSQRFGRQDFTRQVTSEGIDRALAGKSGTGRYLNYEGVPVIGAYQWLDQFELALLVEMEQEEAFAPTQQLAINITLAGIVAASVLVFGVSLLARQIARPILQLTDAARQVADGNLKATAPVVTRDEIGVLARVFNQMTEQLRGLYERMEQQVAARTTELTQTNAQLTSEIAERRRVEAQLWQAKEAAEAANQAKSAFLANMSHELRTPLSSIIGFAQVMQYDKTITSEQCEYLQIISRSGIHLRDLINDVLEMSKIEADRISLDEEEFDLSALLDELMDLFSLRAREKSLDLRLEKAATLPTCIYGDEGKLRQILINLLGNAIKFTHEGYIVLRVVVDNHAYTPLEQHVLFDNNPPTDQDNQHVGPEGVYQLCRFEVEDSGPGISSDDMTQLFSPFFQVAKTRSHVQGTGLGLAISYRYAALMGGELGVDSTVGGGATFRLRLPMLTIDTAGSMGSSAEERRIVGLAPGQPAYRVLVAEDFDDSRLLLVSLLESVGFDVRSVPNGKACIEEWQSWQPHLIWMDIRMPEMNGFEATRAIKHSTNGHQTVIIALTASAFAEERTQIIAAGCDDFVGKPFRDTEIFEHMAKHLGVRYIYQE